MHTGVDGWDENVAWGQEGDCGRACACRAESLRPILLADGLVRPSEAN